jgi:hypothetical protein
VDTVTRRHDDEPVQPVDVDPLRLQWATRGGLPAYPRVTEVWQVINGEVRRVDGRILLNVHTRKECAPWNCTLHSPSQHSMRSMSLVYREDRGMFERQCQHGVGHPDPDDVRHHERRGNYAAGVHGCDGCCARGV